MQLPNRARVRARHSPAQLVALAHRGGEDAQIGRERRRARPARHAIQEARLGGASCRHFARQQPRSAAVAACMQASPPRSVCRIEGLEGTIAASLGSPRPVRAVLGQKRHRNGHVALIAAFTGAQGEPSAEGAPRSSGHGHATRRAERRHEQPETCVEGGALNASRVGRQARSIRAAWAGQRARREPRVHEHAQRAAPSSCDHVTPKSSQCAPGGNLIVKRLLSASIPYRQTRPVS